jgi:hypothetical protein
MSSCAVCRHCGTCKPCPDCGQSHYCSLEHQRLDWDAGHKDVCSPPSVAAGNDTAIVPSKVFDLGVPQGGLAKWAHHTVKTNQRAVIAFLSLTMTDLVDEYGNVARHHDGLTTEEKMYAQEFYESMKRMIAQHPEHHPNLTFGQIIGLEFPGKVAAEIFSQVIAGSVSFGVDKKIFIPGNEIGEPWSWRRLLSVIFGVWLFGIWAGHPDFSMSLTLGACVEVYFMKLPGRWVEKPPKMKR